jgi:hypothetical protein
VPIQKRWNGAGILRDCDRHSAMLDDGPGLLQGFKVVDPGHVETQQDKMREPGRRAIDGRHEPVSIFVFEA